MTMRMISVLLLFSLTSTGTDGKMVPEVPWNSAAFVSSRRHASTVRRRPRLVCGLTAEQGSTERQREAQELLDKVAKVRAEIAALEGKTVQQVEQEAQTKKKLEDERQSREDVPVDESVERKRQNNFLDARGKMITVPVDIDDMISQAARAIERAYADGITRQTVRLALLTKDLAPWEVNQWPGGAQQMYREAAKPLTYELLRELRLRPATNGTSNNSESVMRYPPKRVFDQDIWDFDGSALFTAEAHDGPQGDIQALVFPNTDVKYIKDIAKIDQAMGENRLFLLINPFWRSLDSWGINLLAPNAKNMARSTIFERGYNETYIYSRFQCRGEECVALKVYPYEWQIFAYIEDYFGGQTAVRLGSSSEEPRSTYVTQLLNDREEFQTPRAFRRR